MDAANLRENFKRHLEKRFPNHNYISVKVSDAFYVERHAHALGYDFRQILEEGIIPLSLKDDLHKHFTHTRKVKNPSNFAYGCIKSLELLLEFVKGGCVAEAAKQAVEPKPLQTETPLESYHLLPRNSTSDNMLVQMGKERFANKSSHPWVHLTGVHEHDVILNDLENTPHAFVLACLMDTQIKAERAWAIPCTIMEQYGTDIHALNAVGTDEYADFFSRKSLHRFNNDKAGVFKSGVARIVERYDGDAAKLWRGNPSSAKVVYEFLQFKGAGKKIATMAANILARQFQVEFSDYCSIDVSPDIHICRVMYRMGLIEDMDNTDAVIYRARELNPEFPGIIDFSAWEIGREFCRPTNPKCDACSVKAECLKKLT